MSQIRYLELEELVEIHEQLIERFGGVVGFKGTVGQGLIESALYRPRNKAHYQGADLLSQAGALCFGHAKNHGFNDGNKRIAFAATNAFLLENGWKIRCPIPTVVAFMERCSDEDWTEEVVVAFVKQFAIPYPRHKP